jgi:hypothetical protein
VSTLEVVLVVSVTGVQPATQARRAKETISPERRGRILAAE